MLDLYKVVSQLQNEKRYVHTLGVIEMAKKLGRTYNVDLQQCELAALLHDVTKQLPKDQQLELLSSVDDQFVKDNSALWHSFTGCIYAEYELGINDEVVLDAIKYHTTGKKGCSSLAKVIYLSDYLEHGRDIEEADKFREMIGLTSLDNLYNQVAKARISHELTLGHELHSLTKELYESVI